METQYDFDDIVNRRNTNCGRWDTMDKKYGTRDMIHLGVADMDFRAPVEIRDSLHKILDMGVLGYTDLSDKFFLSIQRWYKKQYNMDIPREWIVFCPRINIASSICVETYTEKGDGIIMHTPAYGPLQNSILKNNRKMLSSCNLLEYLTQRDIQTKNSGVNVRYRGKHRFFKGFNEFIKEKTRRCDNDFEKIERHVFF